MWINPHTSRVLHGYNTTSRQPRRNARMSCEHARLSTVFPEYVVRLISAPAANSNLTISIQSESTASCRGLQHQQKQQIHPKLSLTLCGSDIRLLDCIKLTIFIVFYSLNQKNHLLQLIFLLLQLMTKLTFGHLSNLISRLIKQKLSFAMLVNMQAD